jgi:hypothetical protein
MHINPRWKQLLELFHCAARKAAFSASLGIALGAVASAQTVGSGVLPGGQTTTSPTAYEYFSPQAGGASPVSYQLAGPEQAGQQVQSPTGTCDLDCDDLCDDCIGNWWDNTAIFLAGDGWKGLGEIPAGGYGNNFGIRSGVNTGFALGNSRLRGQLGGSVGFYDLRGRTIGDGDNEELEAQLFFTGGVYKRSDIECGEAWSYGIVWDVMDDNNYGVGGDELTLSQIRAQLGYAINECNEIGVWTAFRATDDEWDVVPGATIDVRPVNQLNFFWHHNWEFGADTTAYFGVADGLSDATFGLIGNAPLSQRVALFGGFNYYIPSAGPGPGGATEEFWNVSFGIAFYPGAKAVNPTVSGHRGLPLLDVANNGTFQVTP